MSDYIKREDARDAILNEFDGDIRYTMTVDEFIGNAIRVLNDIPAVDAVPVVRCKDCERRFTHDCPCYPQTMPEDWFCKDGWLGDVID